MNQTYNNLIESLEDTIKKLKSLNLTSKMKTIEEESTIDCPFYFVNDALLFNCNEQILYYDRGFYCVSVNGYNKLLYLKPKMKKHLDNLVPGKFYFLADNINKIDRLEYYCLILPNDKYCYADGLNIVVSDLKYSWTVIY